MSLSCLSTRSPAPVSTRSPLARRRSRTTSSLRLAVAETLEPRRLFAFGVTTTSSSYIVDNGGDLQFTVLKNGAAVSSTIHLGDITSIKYKGREMLATYAVTSRYSHYEQGLGSNSTISYSIDPNNQWIKITCDNSNDPASATQWYVIRPNDNNIYMASLPTDVTQGPGEGRYIAYLDRNVFSNPEPASDNLGNTGAIEGGDVFGHADGTTTSKFYNDGREMIDNIYHGLTGSASGTPVGAYMFMGNREHSSGGPFFKDIDFQAGSAVEIYNCVFTGHTQTEPFRQGLQGPYSLQFTNGSPPTAPDYAFLDNVGITGLLPAAARGTLTGIASGTVPGQRVTVGLSNSTAQYWTTPDAAGNYTIAGIQPGTYKENLYSQELEVGTRTVTITAAQTTTANIVSTFYYPSPANTVFKIGTWDGTPLGFLNSDKIETEHPSDIRMSTWTATPTFVIGTNTDNQWPMLQFMGVNNSQRISFSLTAAQVQNLTLRIGITQGFAGGRNKVTVNSGQSYQWVSANPTATTDLNSRGVTRGTWRGPNQLYTFNIPASALRAGANTIDLPVISGSFVAGQTWLSPNVCYDAIDLVYTSAASPPAIANFTLSPNNAVMGLSSTRTFTPIAKDAAGNLLTTNTDFLASTGVILPSGVYTAPAIAGTSTLTATAIITRTPGYSVSTSSSQVIASTVSATASTTVTILNSTLIVDGLTATPRSNTQIDLAWFDASTNETGFKVEQSTDGTNFSPLATLPAGSTSYSAFALSPNTTYTFRVRAFNLFNEGSNFTTSATTLTSPSAWYKLNDASGTTFLDSAGSNLTGTTFNGPTWVPGKTGTALNFDGTNDYASLPAASIAGLSSISISLWANLSATPSFSRLFDFGTGTTNYMFLTPKGSTGFARFAIRTPSVPEQGLNATVAIPTGGWVHTVLTLSSSGTATLYLNGTQIGQATGLTLTPASLGTTTQTWLARSQFASDPYLNGAIDDFRIYPSALNASQVNALYTDGASGNLPPTVATPAAASPSNLKTSTTSLSVLGADDAGEANLSYTWSLLSGPDSASVTFTNPASKSTTATFTQTGIYILQAALKDQAGLITTSNTTVTVTSLATTTGTTSTIDYTGQSSHGTFTLRRNTAQQLEFLSANSLIYTLPATTSSLTLLLGPAADALTIDTTNGNPIPTAGLSLDAGTGNNTLLFTGSAAATNTLTLIANTTTLASATPSLENLTMAVATTATLLLPTSTTLGTLSLTGGQATLSPGTNSILTLHSLSLTPTSTLDLADNSLILDYAGPSPLPTLLPSLQSAFNNNTWSGPGLTSSAAATTPHHAIAYAETSDLLALSGTQTDIWHNHQVDATTLLLTYTPTGDTNLDNTLDGLDQSHAIQGLSTGASTYTQGDFNYDGIATPEDYALLNAALTPPPTPRPGNIFASPRSKPVATRLPKRTPTTITRPMLSSRGLHTIHLKSLSRVLISL